MMYVGLEKLDMPTLCQAWVEGSMPGVEEGAVHSTHQLCGEVRGEERGAHVCAGP